MTGGDHPPDDPAAFSPEALERGRKLFAGECVFLKGAVSLATLPDPDLPEIAFAGRSNVGKSTLLNALTGRNGLARASNTPGRTRELNFFRLADVLSIADLPGYGYARAAKTEIKRWTALTRDYLRGRPNLRRVLLLIDARHGPKPSDVEIMGLFDEAAVPFQIVLTKADKIKTAELERQRDRTELELKRHAAGFPILCATSSVKGGGLPELRATLAELIAS